MLLNRKKSFLKQIQEKVKKFCKENKLESSVEHRVLDLMSEVGELAKEVLKMTDYGRKDFQFRKEAKAEIGDVLFSLITVANSLDVGLEESLDIVLEKYKKRLKKGSAGSENE